MSATANDCFEPIADMNASTPDVQKHCERGLRRVDGMPRRHADEWSVCRLNQRSDFV